MPVNRISFKIVLVILLFGCSTVHKNKRINVNDRALGDPINIAIGDFKKNTRLYKKGKVFVVWVNEKQQYKGNVIVTIGRNPTKILLGKNGKVGSKGFLPSRYIEENGKLFFGGMIIFH